MTTAEEIFAQVVPQALADAQRAEAFAPANIALSKYWGKRDKALNLPLNSSLSISLGTLGTTTVIDAAVGDKLTFNGTELSTTDPFAAKVWRYVDLFRGVDGPKLSIETTNTIPTAAGLASSASGFAALVMSLDRAFNAFGTGVGD